MEYEEFQVGETYATKLATQESFTIERIELNVKKDKIIRFWGVYPSRPHLLNCPISPERLISPIVKTTIKVAEIQKHFKDVFTHDMPAEDFKDLRMALKKFFAEKLMKSMEEKK